MSILISIKDETFSGKVTNELEVGFSSETVTAKEIIDARVRSEVKAYNNKLPGYFNGLVEPTDSEKSINGYKLKTNKPIDEEKQVYVALDAFKKNAFFILVDNLQLHSLDQQVQLNDHTRISFIKLTPLVGG